MFVFTRKTTLSVSLIFGLMPAVVNAQSQHPGTYMHVHAPFAQSLVMKVKAAHNDDLVKLGLHAVPPGESDNVIVANITPSKNGKKSSAVDMEKLANGKPVAVRLDKEKCFDLLIPITDAKGAISAVALS